MRSFLFFCT